VQLVCLLLAAFDFKVVENMSLACWELKLWETESSYEIYMLLRGQIQGIIGDALMIYPIVEKNKNLRKKLN
jgi:hypothetical protein